MELKNRPARDRIVLADALRGFALMGLFIVHMVEYFELYWYKPEPGWVHDLVFFLFGGKAYGVFALLFGLSFYIMLDNYQRRGVDFRLRFCWRLSLLLVMGYLHSLLYAGDILQLLAINGFLLVATHRFSTVQLSMVTAFFLLQVPQMIMILVHMLFPSVNYSEPAFYALMANNFDQFAHADLSNLLSYNLLEGQIGKWAFFLETGRFWNITGLMFMGVVLGRIGFFEKNTPKAKTILVGMVAGGCIYLVSVKLLPMLLINTTGMAAWAGAQLFEYYANLALIAVGVLFFVQLFQWSISRTVLQYFAPAGKMTLTFYILQSVLFVPVFYGFGLNAYSTIGQLNSLALGLVCWGVQLFVAHVWLQKFQYGPLEWLWRKGTHYKFSVA